jgi:4-hydroxymandelate oxidase
MLNAFNIEDLHTIARERLAAPVYGYYAGGAGDELTLRDNIEAFQRIKIAYRTMIDISNSTMQTSLLGIDLSMPIILAPTALHRMAHDEGEVATARAAAEAGTLMTLSTISSVMLEDVAAAAPGGRRWFQLYMFNTPEQTEALISRSEAAGYEAIVLTADAPILGRRERDLRLGFTLPEGVQAVHFDLVPRSTFSSDEPPTIGAFIHQPDLSWDQLGWIRERTKLPIILNEPSMKASQRSGCRTTADASWTPASRPPMHFPRSSPRSADACRSSLTEGSAAAPMCSKPWL